MSTSPSAFLSERRSHAVDGLIWIEEELVRHAAEGVRLVNRWLELKGEFRAARDAEMAAQIGGRDV